MKSVFFYGLFMDQDLLTEKGFHPHGMKPTCLKGFGLRIGQKATLEQADGECSYGTVIQLESDELDRLYRSDGVKDYVPQPVVVAAMDGEPIETITYILPMDMIAGRNSEYAIALAGIAKKLDLPEDYIREIETWI
jgi:hypothetical protein